MRAKAVNFNVLVNELRDQELTFVSTYGVKDSLNKFFVSFIDLMGFSHTLTVSTHGAIHKMTRFHRALDLAFSNASDIRQFRFTDCAFILFPDLRNGIVRLLNFTNYLLALNAALITEGKHFAHLVIPRVTLTYGNTLVLDSELQLKDIKGLDPKFVLAGPTVARAHQLEKHAPPFGIFIDRYCIKMLKDPSIWTVKGITHCVMEYINSFDSKHGKYSHFHRDFEGIIFPWLLLAVRHGHHSRLHRAHSSDITERAKVLLKIIDLFWGDFRVRVKDSKISPEMCNNIGLLDRMIVDHYSIAKGRIRPVANIKELLNIQETND